jgi:hypothetical protein
MAVISPDHDLYPDAAVTCVQCTDSVPDGHPVVRWAADDVADGPVLYWHSGCVEQFVAVVSEDAAHLAGDEAAQELRRHARELAAQFRGVEARPGDEYDHAPWPADEAAPTS